MREALFALLLLLAASPLPVSGQGTNAQGGKNASSSPVYITRQRAFSFPMNVPPAATLGGEPAVVELYFSADRGATWTRYDARNLQAAANPGRPAPDARAATAPFVVQTDRDGEYYFASRILDALNRPLYQPVQLPEQRVIVDTVPPRLEFSVTAGPSGEVHGKWSVSDEHLKADSLALEYQPSPSESWRPLAFDRPGPNSNQTSLEGVATWFPQTSEHAVSLRATVYDWAGNSTVLTRTAVFQDPNSPTPQNPGAIGPLASNPGSTSNAYPPGQTAPTSNGPMTAVAPLLAGPPAAAAAAPVVAAPPAAPVVSGVPAVGAIAVSPALPAQAPSAEPIPWPDDNSGPTRTPALGNEYPYRRADANTVSETTAPPLLNGSRDGHPAPGAYAYPTTNAPPRVAAVSDSAARPLPPSPAPPIGPQSLPSGERPRMTNARRFNLDYDVSAVGPQGVAKVELWLTRDGGQTWQAWATDPDRESPMEVSLAEEGVYGFRVVVTGRNGLAGKIPVAGEMADAWIGIDTTVPMTRLTAAKYGAGKQAGQLDIRWEADDVMLAARPVTLLFGETPQGPWTIIATGLPNTGSYNWAVDPRTPKNIYLRIEVCDEAGNLGIDQLREPITLEGLQPKARVKGIQPVEEVGLNPRRSVLFR